MKTCLLHGPLKFDDPYYNIPTPWKLCCVMPRKRDRTYKRYKVTDLY